jgi:hypothetical protein
MATLDSWIGKTAPGISRAEAIRRLIGQALGTSTPPKHNARMAPLKTEPPAMERDSRGKAISLKQRTRDDQEKAKPRKIARVSPKKKVHS